MATRDPHIVSEQYIPTDSGMAVVRETKTKEGNKFKLLNPEDIDPSQHGKIMEIAKTSETKEK